MRLHIAVCGPTDQGALDGKTAVYEAIRELSNQASFDKYDMSLHPKCWPEDTHANVALEWDGESETIEQIIERSAAVVVIFHSRFGTDTSDWQSGSQAEVDIACRLKKPCHVYFFDGEPAGDADPDHLLALREYRDSLEREAQADRVGGLYGTWSSIHELVAKVTAAIEADVAKISRDQADAVGSPAWLAAHDFARYVMPLADLEPPQSANLLDYFSGLVEFHGRGDELSALTEFCESDQLVSWWSITGEGGSGKSRLAFEFCQRMRESGWDALFLPSDFFITKFGSFSNWDYPKDLLLVVDYVSFHAAETGLWLASLAAQKNHHRLRILLLEREDFDSRWTGKTMLGCPGWYRGLVSAPGQRHIQALCFRPQAPSLSLGASPLTLDDMVGIIAAIGKSQSVEIPITDAHALVERLESTIDPDHLRPLFLLFLLQAYVDDPSSDWRTWSQEELQRKIYDREVRFLEERIRATEMFAVWRLAAEAALNLWAFATATGTFNLADVAGWEYIGKVLSRVPTNEHQALATALRKHCGGNGFDVTPYRPDIPGEYLVLMLLAEHRDATGSLDDFIQSAWATNPERFRDFLQLAISDFTRTIIPEFVDILTLDEILQEPASPEAYVPYVELLAGIHHFPNNSTDDLVARISHVASEAKTDQSVVAASVEAIVRHRVDTSRILVGQSGVAGSQDSRLLSADGSPTEWDFVDMVREIAPDLSASDLEEFAGMLYKQMQKLVVQLMTWDMPNGEMAGFLRLVDAGDEAGSQSWIMSHRPNMVDIAISTAVTLVEVSTAIRRNLPWLSIPEVVQHAAASFWSAIGFENHVVETKMLVSILFTMSLHDDVSHDYVSRELQRIRLIGIDHQAAQDYVGSLFNLTFGSDVDEDKVLDVVQALDVLSSANQETAEQIAWLLFSSVCDPGIDDDETGVIFSVVSQFSRQYPDSQVISLMEASCVVVAIARSKPERLPLLCDRLVEIEQTDNLLAIGVGLWSMVQGETLVALAAEHCRSVLGVDASATKVLQEVVNTLRRA